MYYSSNSHLLDGPVLEDIVDVSLIVDRDEQTPGPPEEDPVFLASKANSGRVDDGHQLLQMVLQQTEEETLVTILRNGGGYGDWEI